MAENKITTIKPPSHFRGISSIANHCNDFAFMPKFFIKTLQRKKQHHRRQPSIIFPTGIKLDVEKNSGLSLGRETRGNVAATDTKARKSHQLLSKNVGSIMSVLFRNKKKLSDKDVSLPKHKRVLSSSSSDFRDKKYGSKSSDKGYSLVKQSSVSVKRVSMSITTAFRDGKRGLMSVKGKEQEESSSSSGEKTFVGKSFSKLRSMEVKPGLRIKGLTRMLSRDDKRVELCKKKILMGGKCKPISGRLLYDENGVLVPEDLPDSADLYNSQTNG